MVGWVEAAPGQGPTREDYKRSVAEIRDDISITSVTIEEQIAEGDTVVTKYTQSSIQQREILGVPPPTGEEETFVGIRIDRISESKTTEEWGTYDALPTMESLAQEIRERELINQDLRVARGIQQATLPKDVPTLEGWQINPYDQPAREVGGDFYDFHLLSEGRLGLVTGDATGKGVPEALVMSTTCGICCRPSQKPWTPHRLPHSRDCRPDTSPQGPAEHFPEPEQP